MNVSEINGGYVHRQERGSKIAGAGGFREMVSRAAEEKSKSAALENSGERGEITEFSEELSFMNYAPVNAGNKIENVSLEDMLRSRHPNLAYHVFDASTSDWRNRNDYPHYLLYQDTERAAEKVANWKPEGKNPVYSPFEAPPEIWSLGSVPSNSKAVIIHPKVQERMDADPEYAKEIFNRIEAWFDFDIARNEAIMPGCSFGMCQAVAIGEDGSIVNAQASNPLSDRITTSGCTPEEAMKRLRKKIARQYYFIQLHSDAVLERRLEAQQENADFVSTAKKRLLAMMNDITFRSYLGNNITGMSIDRLFEITSNQLGGIF